MHAGFVSPQHPLFLLNGKIIVRVIEYCWMYSTYYYTLVAEQLSRDGDTVHNLETIQVL